MNKTDLIAAISADTELSLAEAGRVVDATIAAIVDAVSSGDTVTLVGFGGFKAQARAAREGKNPQTGEALSIAATTVPKFSAGTAFKAAVAKAA